MPPFERESKRGSKPPKYITIKTSTIRGAGLGAFATCDIPKGSTIGEYLGKNKPPTYESSSAYMFSVYDGNELYRVIDGKSKKYASWVRYVNTTPTDREANCYFFQYQKRIFIRTKKNVPAGQEIFAYYGDDYVNELEENIGGFKQKYVIREKMTGRRCK